MKPAKFIFRKRKPIRHFRRWLRYQMLRYSFSREREILNMQHFLAGKLLGTCDNERTQKLIVSLTSFPKRMEIPHVVPLALYSLLNQSMKPDKIILYLSEEEFPRGETDVPQEILDFVSHGLAIRFVEKNIRSYKKLVPALREFPYDFIVTADDDIWYPSNWLKKLWETSLRYPGMTIGHRFKYVTTNCERIMNYNSWDCDTPTPQGAYRNFLTGGGGSLYPPGILHRNVVKEELFMKIAPTADDIWFWAMTVLNGNKIAVVPHGYNAFIGLLPEENPGPMLSTENVYASGNDIAIKQLFAHYPELEKIVLAEKH